MNQELEIEITRLSPEVPLPQYETTGAVAFDIAAFENAIVNSQEIAKIRSGLIFSIPQGFALIVVNRSSRPIKLGFSLPHGIGILDQDYRGSNDELLIQIQNITSQTIEIQKGLRIAQGFIIPIVKAL